GGGTGLCLAPGQIVGAVLRRAAPTTPPTTHGARYSFPSCRIRVCSRQDGRTIGQVTSSQSAGDIPHCVLSVVRSRFPRNPAAVSQDGSASSFLERSVHNVAGSRSLLGVTCSSDL